MNIEIGINESCLHYFTPEQQDQIKTYANDPCFNGYQGNEIWMMDCWYIPKELYNEFQIANGKHIWEQNE